MAETPPDIQIKYQKLAAEYSKLRAQAQVLRKGVVQEQERSSSLTDMLKEYEQRVRKTDLEMESLNFRNQQLTKRIGVLQEELDRQAKHSDTKGAKTSSNNLTEANNIRSHVIDEELRSKIVENAQLVTTILDKDVELSAYEEKIRLLENDLSILRSHNNEVEHRNNLELKKLMEQVSELNLQLSLKKESKGTIIEPITDIISLGSDEVAISAEELRINEQLNKARKQIVSLQQEMEKYKVDSALLAIFKTSDSSAPEKSEQTSDSTINLLGTMAGSCNPTSQQFRAREQKLTEYFLTRINELVSETEHAKSLCDNLMIESNALELRLEETLNEKAAVEEISRTTEMSLRSLQEELSTTSHNYELQLSTMSDHLANMNDTLAKQTDQIQQLQYKLKQPEGKRHK